jgi:hypothetical protein
LNLWPSPKKTRRSAPTALTVRWKTLSKTTKRLGWPEGRDSRYELSGNGMFAGDPAAVTRDAIDRTGDDVYDVGMIRKQLYISDDHERALKAKAREARVSEAELIRGLLDRLLLGSEGNSQVPLGRAQAALDFLEATDEISTSHRFAEDYRFDREGLYEERGTPGRTRRVG